MIGLGLQDAYNDFEREKRHLGESTRTKEGHNVRVAATLEHGDLTLRKDLLHLVLKACTRSHEAQQRQGRGMSITSRRTHSFHSNVDAEIIRLVDDTEGTFDRD